jgi:hypothetical protein
VRVEESLDVFEFEIGLYSRAVESISKCRDCGPVFHLRRLGGRDFANKSPQSHSHRASARCQVCEESDNRFNGNNITDESEPFHFSDPWTEKDFGLVLAKEMTASDLTEDRASYRHASHLRRSY